MAKKQPTLPAVLNGTLAGFDIKGGNVERLENGDYSVKVRPPRKKYLEQTVYPASRVESALTGEDGWVVINSLAVDILGVEVLPDTAEAINNGTLYETETGETLFVSDKVNVELSSEITDEEDAPAKTTKKAPAKKSSKVVEEDDEDEEEEDEDDEEEEEAPKKSTKKAPAKGKKPTKVVEEDDEDEEEEDEDEEEEAPKKSTKKTTKKAPAKGKKKDEDEDEDDEDLEF